MASTIVLDTDTAHNMLWFDASIIHVSKTMAYFLNGSQILCPLVYTMMVHCRAYKTLENGPQFFFLFFFSDEHTDNAVCFF